MTPTTLVTMAARRASKTEGTLGERRHRDLWCEVDDQGLVERIVDPAAVEEGVDQLAARFLLVDPEGARVAEPGQYDLVAVRQIRQELSRRDLRRSGEVKLPAHEERLDLRHSYAAVLVLARCRGPGFDQPAATCTRSKRAGGWTGTRHWRSWRRLSEATWLTQGLQILWRRSGETRKRNLSRGFGAADRS